MKKYFTIVVTLLLLSSCITQELSQDTLFRPTKEYALTNDYSLNQSFTHINDSVKIETWHLTKPEARINIIYLSGNGSNIRSAIPLFNAINENMDANIFSFNYRGFGQSTGTPSITNLTEDSKTVLEHFLEDLNTNDLPNILIGYSLGGYVALNAGNLPEIDAIATIATFTSSYEVEKYLLKNALPGIIKPFLKIKVDESIYQLNNLVALEKIDKPMIFIHGEMDEFIPVSMSEELKNNSQNSSSSILIVENADHGTIIKDPTKTKIIGTELNKLINKNIIFPKSELSLNPK